MINYSFKHKESKYERPKGSFSLDTLKITYVLRSSLTSTSVVSNEIPPVLRTM